MALQEREWVGTARNDRVPLIRDTSAQIRGNGVRSDPRQTACAADAPWNPGTPNRDPFETLKSHIGKAARRVASLCRFAVPLRRAASPYRVAGPCRSAR